METGCRAPCEWQHNADGNVRQLTAAILRVTVKTGHDRCADRTESEGHEDMLHLQHIESPIGILNVAIILA